MILFSCQGQNRCCSILTFTIDWPAVRWIDEKWIRYVPLKNTSYIPLNWRIPRPFLESGWGESLTNTLWYSLCTNNFYTAPLVTSSDLQSVIFRSSAFFVFFNRPLYTLIEHQLIRGSGPRVQVAEMPPYVLKALISGSSGLSSVKSSPRQGPRIDSRTGPGTLCQVPRSVRGSEDADVPDNHVLPQG